MAGKGKAKVLDAPVLLTALVFSARSGFGSYFYRVAKWNFSSTKVSTIG